MRLYCLVRNWVDRCWQSTGNWRVLALPPIALALLLLMLGRESGLAWAGYWTFFVTWTGFTFWRWWVFMRLAANKSDQKYDRTGKFNLAREYWDTESVSVAAARKKKNG